MFLDENIYVVCMPKEKINLLFTFENKINFEELPLQRSRTKTKEKKYTGITFL